MATETSTIWPKLTRALPYILVVGGVIGLGCSFIILLDKIQLIMNSSFHPNCDLNPVISCGSVMASKQGSAFGFPNPIIGLAAFSVIITVGVAILAGAQFKKWFWLGLNTGLLGGVLSVHWLFFESVYRIHALCPYCMGVWVVTITMFWYVLLYNLTSGYISFGTHTAQLVHLARKHHLEIVIVWLLIITALILQHFWYYYGKYL